MTDIVERLRWLVTETLAPFPVMIAEAADEIENLRLERDALRALVADLAALDETEWLKDRTHRLVIRAREAIKETPS